MDLICPVCSEPWELDALHEVVLRGRPLTFDRAYATFRETGCSVFECAHGDGVADPRVRATYDLLGDDADGAAATFEDMLT